MKTIQYSADRLSLTFILLFEKPQNIEISYISYKNIFYKWLKKCGKPVI